MAPPAQPSRAKNLTGALMDYVRDHAKKGGVVLDRYDADYIIGIQMEWLEKNDAALTKTGVRRFRR